MYHDPVLADEVRSLFPAPRRVVDGTLGDGGHAALFLDAGATVLGIDRDPVARARAGERLAGRPIEIRAGNVFDPDNLEAIRAFGPDGILLDLGVSSRQLDDADLGFSFRPGTRLDMRLSGSGATAADLLASATEQELAGWLRDYGDEPRARRLARVIARRRARAPFETSDDLVNAIREALGPTSGAADFARLFQALRIAVNDELPALEGGLPELRDALVGGGTLAVISYHSGEDRIVKHAFREWSRACVCPPELYRCECRGRPLGRTLTRRPVTPSPAEIERNPRARSAKLRAFQVASAG
ncbi:MAG: 16S rRNA (cytosine(1402)-N(4))-methyltransferase RsmH [Gemmatimonadales bacterium]